MHGANMQIIKKTHIKIDNLLNILKLDHKISADIKFVLAV